MMSNQSNITEKETAAAVQMAARLVGSGDVSNLLSIRAGIPDMPNLSFPVGVRLDLDVHKALKEEALKEGRSLSAMIAKVCADHVAASTEPPWSAPEPAVATEVSEPASVPIDEPQPVPDDGPQPVTDWMTAKVRTPRRKR